MADVVNLNSLQLGEQAEILARVEARSGAQMTLGLHDMRFDKHRSGFITVTKNAAPFTITGNFDTLPAGESPEQFKVRKVIAILAVGDHVITTDGVHYIVQVVGSDDPGAQLPPGMWSPSLALRPQYDIAAIGQNLGH